MEKDKRRNLVKKIIIIILILLMLIGFYIKSSTEYNTSIPTTFPELHNYAIKINDESHLTDEDSDENKSAVVICGSNATVHLNDNIVDYYYKNVYRSKSSVVIQLLIDNKVIAQSGGLPPGYQTYKIDYNQKIKLSPGTYEGVVIISFYNLDTNELETVNSKISIPIIIEK